MKSSDHGTTETRSKDDITKMKHTKEYTIKDIKKLAKKRAQLSVTEGYSLQEEKLQEKSKKEFNEHAGIYVEAFLEARRIYADKTTTEKNVIRIARKRGRDAAKRGCAFNLANVEVNAKKFPGFEQCYIDENKRAHEAKLNRHPPLEATTVASLKASTPDKNQTVLVQQSNPIGKPTLQVSEPSANDLESKPKQEALGQQRHLEKIRAELASYSNLLKKEYPEQDLVVVPKQMYYLLVEHWESHQPSEIANNAEVTLSVPTSVLAPFIKPKQG